MLNWFLYSDFKFKVQNCRGPTFLTPRKIFMKMWYLFLRDSARFVIFSCNQAAVWALLSVRLSVHMSRHIFWTMEITLFELIPHLPGANELKHLNWEHWLDEIKVSDNN